jgi:hypothetical protein
LIFYIVLANNTYRNNMVLVVKKHSLELAEWLEWKSTCLANTRSSVQAPVPKNKSLLSQAQVAHAYNPSYSGGRDQEDRGSKPAQANSL